LREVKAITSGPRTFERSVKKAAKSVDKNGHDEFAEGRNELDTRADTICAGKNFRLLALTGQSCDVSGFHQDFDSIKDVPVAQVATAMTMDNGEVIVLVINEALWFGKTMDHSLINPNQIRAFGIDVSDNPFDESKDFGINHDECFIPFDTAGSTVYFDTFVPTDEQLRTCRHIELTSDEEWDPNSVDMNHSKKPSRARIIQRMQRHAAQALRNETRETDLHLSSVSEAYCPQLFAQRLVESVNIESRQEMDERETRAIKQVQSNTRHSVITPERVSRVFGVGLNTAKQTLAVTTQQGIRRAVHPLTRRYRVDHLNLNRNKLGGQWYLDRLIAQKKSINQMTSAWIYTNGHFTEAYPVTKGDKIEAAACLNEFCTDVGVPANLKSDRAGELVGRTSDFYKLARKKHINLTYAEPERKNQIWPVDLEIRELKKRVKNKMRTKNAPARVWDFCLVHQAKISQLLSRNSLRGRTGYEEVTGKTPDISEYLDFDF
jgi:hypothetical protein